MKSITVSMDGLQAARNAVDNIDFSSGSTVSHLLALPLIQWVHGTTSYQLRVSAELRIAERCSESAWRFPAFYLRQKRDDRKVEAIASAPGSGRRKPWEPKNVPGILVEA